jgi:metal-responsive CopG/Arc/MetJ family transcriptional regulator
MIAMKATVVRTNFSLPADLLSKLRKFVPRRKYSAFVQQAIDEKLKQEAKKQLLEAAGSVNVIDIPEWAEPVEYVRRLREAGNKRKAI